MHRNYNLFSVLCANNFYSGVVTLQDKLYYLLYTRSYKSKISITSVCVSIQDVCFILAVLYSKEETSPIRMV